MRSSRISICLMNTRRSGDQQIRTPFIATLEAGDEVILFEILEQLVAHAYLQVLCGLEILLFQGLNISREIHASNITANVHARFLDPPLRNQPIAFEALLQL